jgi:hypothetical protein
MLKKPNTRPRKWDADRRLELRKRNLKFGTWNVQGCRNKMEEIIREINLMNMDVIVLTETKRKEQEMKHWEIIYTFTAA